MESPCGLVLTPASSAAGKRIATIEGVSGKVAEACRRHGSGSTSCNAAIASRVQIMSAIALLNGKPKPADADIENAMEATFVDARPNIRIRAAIHEASSRLG